MVSTVKAQPRVLLSFIITDKFWELTICDDSLKHVLSDLCTNLFSNRHAKNYENFPKFPVMPSIISLLISYSMHLSSGSKAEYSFIRFKISTKFKVCIFCKGAASLHLVYLSVSSLFHNHRVT